jgi:hypothetical protein
MPKKIQPTGLLGLRLAINAPSVGHASDNSADAAARTWSGLSGGVRKLGVRKSSSRLDAISNVKIAHKDHDSQAATRGPIAMVLAGSARSVGVASVKRDTIVPAFQRPQETKVMIAKNPLERHRLSPSHYQGTRCHPTRASAPTGWAILCSSPSVSLYGYKISQFSVMSFASTEARSLAPGPQSTVSSDDPSTA